MISKPSSTDQPSAFNAARFHDFAGDAIERWMLLRGLSLMHTSLGEVEVIAVDKLIGGTIRLTVQLPDGATPYLTSDKLTTGIVQSVLLPSSLAQHIKLSLDRTSSEILYRRLLFRHLHSISTALDNSHFMRTLGYDWPAEEVVTAITHEDRLLAKGWQSSNEDWEVSKMLSARMAERAVKRFYEKHGHVVDDVSLTQLTSSQNGDWRTHDLLIDGHRPIDVKNARNPINHPDGYLEHTVQAFKADRRGQAVSIAGVLSPYLTLQHLNGTSLSNPAVAPVRFLGETSRAKVADLIATFHSHNLRLEMDAANYLPPWVFEFPGAPSDPEMQRLVRSLTGVQDADFIVRDRHSTKPNPLPIILTLSLPIPIQWSRYLSSWHISLADRLIQLGNPISLPYIFLEVLSTFVSTSISIGQRDSDFHPRIYRDLLFIHSSWTSWPLDVFDPLCTVSTLCQNLEVLWDNRDRIRLQRYEIFRFQGKGLLQARVNDSSRLITLIAYCGGRIPGKGKCGNSSLVAGREENCPHCGRLVCPICGYCSDNCVTAFDGSRS